MHIISIRNLGRAAPPPEPAGRGQSLDPDRFRHIMMTSKGRKKPAAPKGGRFVEGAPRRSGAECPKGRAGGTGGEPVPALLAGPFGRCGAASPPTAYGPGPAARHDTPPAAATRGIRPGYAKPSIMRQTGFREPIADSPQNVWAASARSSYKAAAEASPRFRTPIKSAASRPTRPTWGAMPPGPTRQNGQAPR